MKTAAAVWAFIVAVMLVSEQQLAAQEKIKLDYSSVDTSNAVWYTAQEAGFFKKHGLDAQLIFIPSTTTAVSSIIAGDVPVGNTAGSGVASAADGSIFSGWPWKRLCC